jgi:hypothetical protein
MTRRAQIGTLALLGFLAAARPAGADVTAFWGLSPTPAGRSTSGFALGVNLVLVGFEFEYGNTRENEIDAAPGLKTGMFNVIGLTPTHVQLYVTAGGGLFRERYRSRTETSIGTNVGGGIKLPLAGPLRLRIDYRVYSLRGDPLYSHPQRVYAGLSFSF